VRNAGPFVFSESPILKIIEKILGGHCFWRPCPHIYMFVCHIYNWNLLKYPCFEWSERAFFCRVVCSLQHKGDSQVSGNYIVHICIYIIESDYIEYQKFLFRYLTIKKIYIEYPVMLPSSLSYLHPTFFLLPLLFPSTGVGWTLMNAKKLIF